VALVTQCLSGKHEALSSNPRTAKKSDEGLTEILLPWVNKQKKQIEDIDR
jgi:hypothetical protein